MTWLIFIVGLLAGTACGMFVMCIISINKKSKNTIERDMSDPLYRWARYTYLQLESAHGQKLFSGWAPIELILVNAPDEVALPSVTDRMYGCN